MQDTFLKVWRCGPQYDETKGRLFTWLISIARNAAIDATRSSFYQNSRKTDNLDQLLQTACGETVHMDISGLSEAVQKRSPKYKKLIDLIYLQGYTHKEAAAETGIPIGTIKTRIRSAIGHLKKYMTL